MPKVSIIIPVFNGGLFIGDAIQSVLNQTFQDFEIIVVNDGSTDKTMDVLKKFDDHASLRIYSQSNQGDIASRNTGIELSQGDYIAFCDSDDIWNKDHVGLIVDQLERFPETGMAFDNVAYFLHPGEQEEKGGAPPASSEERLLVDAARAKAFAAGPVSLQDIYTDNLITTSAFMVPKRVFARVGVFDTDIYLMNDLHLFYRIAAYYNVRFVDYVGVKKRVHAASLSMVNTHHEYGVNCLENIRDRYPEVCRRIGKRIFNKKLGRKYLRLGLHYEKYGDVEKAKDMYKKALLTRKLDLRYYWEYIRASLL